MPVTATPLLSTPPLLPPPPPPGQATPTRLNAAVTSALVRPRSVAAVSTPQAPLLKVLLGVQYSALARAITWNAFWVFQPAVVANFQNALLYTPERSEEHTSELQSLMRISYAVFCLNKKIKNNKQK